MKIESKLIKDLKPATYNPRQISTKQYKHLKASIEKFSLVDPIIINKDMTVIGGHQRLKICKELKHTEIDCVVLDLSKEEERELNIRLNKNTGDFDMDILANEFDIDELVDWGFKHIDLDINIDKITEGNTEDDHIPEVKESRVKLGDVWKLGKHRLMCGDSTKESDVEKLMNGQKADMVFTDPPYGMNLDTDYSSIKGTSKMAKTLTPKKHRKVIGDDMEFNPTFLLNIFSKTKEVFLWGADYYCNYLPKNGSWVVWDKTGGNDSLMNAGFASNFELCWSKKKHKRDIARITWKGVCGRAGQKTIHPTQKPIQLAEWFFDNWGKDTEIVVDLFLGSGSTLIACEKTNRTCYGMELDTKYCDVIIERWEQFTGQKAKKCG